MLILTNDKKIIFTSLSLCLFVFFIYFFALLYYPLPDFITHMESKLKIVTGL